MLSQTTRSMIYDVCTRVVIAGLIVSNVIIAGDWLLGGSSSGIVADIALVLQIASKFVLRAAIGILAIGLILLGPV